MAISHALNQSRRKVYYQLDKINQALPKGVDQIISYPRLGILLTADQKAACRLLLEEVTDYNYVMKSDERRRLSSIYIAVSTERVTIDKLMQINDVSRNTILNDLTELRKNWKTNNTRFSFMRQRLGDIILVVIQWLLFNTCTNC